jgi:Zn finger protein HypA/HybF involved in hydrogenase expression
MNPATTFDSRPRPSPTEGVAMANYEGYCVKCREKREFDGQEVELANGRRAAQGTCPTCGTKMNRILGKAKV